MTRDGTPDPIGSGLAGDTTASTHEGSVSRVPAPRSAPDRHYEIDDLPDDAVQRTVEHAWVRRFLAIVLSLGMTMAMLLVMVGGLLGRFDTALIIAVFGAYSTGFTAAAYFYFRKGGDPQGRA